MTMNYGKVGSFKKAGAAYQNAERQAVAEINDPHAIVLTMFDELIKSMTIFADNVDLKSGGVLELKSKHFARSLTIIYALQSSLDFEKGGDIANNLFQLYEYARQQLMSDMREIKSDGTRTAMNMLGEIREAWTQIKPE